MPKLPRVRAKFCASSGRIGGYSFLQRSARRMRYNRRSHRQIRPFTLRSACYACTYTKCLRCFLSVHRVYFNIYTLKRQAHTNARWPAFPGCDRSVSSLSVSHSLSFSLSLTLFLALFFRPRFLFLISDNLVAQMNANPSTEIRTRFQRTFRCVRNVPIRFQVTNTSQRPSIDHIAIDIGGKNSPTGLRAMKFMKIPRD